MKHITQDQFKIMPWKNGGGTTTEIFRLDGGVTDEFVIRLSMAKVEKDGPFSLFPGYNRHLVILDGNGCILASEGKQLALTIASNPYFFEGEKEIACNLISGPVVDFNVFVNRHWGEAIVDLSNDSKDLMIKCEDDMLFFYDLQEKELWILTKGEEFKSRTRKSITIRINKK